MNNFTDEQSSYIFFNELIDTKLIATAGSGKTHTIIHKLDYMITNNILDKKQILMLTFSRFTRDDFINRINSCNITSIDTKYIKTIDSFAKNIIDPNNEVDVSILSFKLMKYLEKETAENIKENKLLKNIKAIFVDEAQDLNNTQYMILKLLKKKNNTIINLIGDPNQNIYQFRGSSDKYLTNFKAKTFHLTYNFRSHQEIVNFSKYLRPNQDIDIICKKPQIDKLPFIFFYKDENDLETNILSIINSASSMNIDLSDFAILSPTRGRMRTHGKSSGLCLISNILSKHKIKFCQFYEESTDETSNNIKYEPVPGYINLLTFMGSKGLQWKYTILIDAETCLINKNIFDDEKHKNDQYLLYVSCSRAINNLIIFTKYSNDQFGDACHFNLNPWFSFVPNNLYVLDNRFDNFKFPEIDAKNIMLQERKINKILDNCSENELYSLAAIIGFGIGGNKTIKENIQIYNIPNNFEPKNNFFISKFTKELFISYYNIINNLDKKKFEKIENIIEMQIISDKLPQKFLKWYNNNKFNFSWDKIDTYEPDIVDIINNNFNRNKKLSDHIIIHDCYFKNFIFSNIEDIKDNYNKYLACNDFIKIKKYLFKIIIIIYATETQHYYHVINKGKKFKNLVGSYSELFSNMLDFLQKKTLNIPINHFGIKIDKLDLVGDIDFLDYSNNYYDIKCCSDISLKHIIQQSACIILHKDMHNQNKNIEITTNFINLLSGNISKINFILTPKKINNILSILIKNKKNS